MSANYWISDLVNLRGKGNKLSQYLNFVCLLSTISLPSIKVDKNWTQLISENYQIAQLFRDLFRSQYYLHGF